MNQTPLNPEALNEQALFWAGHAVSLALEEMRTDDSLSKPERIARRAITAYLAIAQKDLERRIRTEVCRIVANASNWPTPVGTQMLGRDLAEPIDKIVEAVLPVIHESSAKTQKGTAS